MTPALIAALGQFLLGDGADDAVAAPLAALLATAAELLDEDLAKVRKEAEEKRKARLA